MKRVLELRESSAHTGNATSRWRTVFIALVLALTIGSASQAPPVLAAPAAANDIYFDLNIYPEKLPRICVNQRLTLYASVSKTIYKGLIGLDGKEIPIPGQKPAASVIAFVNKGPGTIEKISASGSSENKLFSLSGEDVFTFISDKPGKVTLQFTTVVKPAWIGANEKLAGEVLLTEYVTVQVGCKFKVKAIQQAIVAGGGNFNIVAMIDEAEITGDEQGHFTGTTPVNWVGAASNVGVCSVSINVASTTQANITGDMDESGQLTGNLSIGAPETTVTGTCAGVSNTSQMSLSADPLRFSVPSSGGVVKVAQGFVFETANMPGSAVIVVVPVEDEAAAFSPGNQAALFPWIFGASVGLALTQAFKSKKIRVTHLISKRLTILLLIFILLLVSCQTGTDTPPADSQVTDGPVPDSQVTDTPPVDSQESDVLTIQADVVFGPGTFIFPDTEAGLAGLSSYKSTLTLSFDGTRAGQTEQWSKTYVMLNTQEPAARQLTIELTGDVSSPDAVFIAEVDGAAYERRGENACNATVIDQENSLIERLKPFGLLTGVVGAEEAGAETVNDVASDHYTFDERAFGQSDIAQSTGEMWVASVGGYIVKYALTTKGDADYFGEGIEGTLTWDYELTDVNQPVTFALPDDCPPGMVDVPLLPDASNVLNMPSILAYDTASSLADIATFYQSEIPNLGWELTGEPTITDTTVLLDFTQGDQTMAIVVITSNGTTVNVILGKSQE